MIAVWMAESVSSSFSRRTLRELTSLRSRSVSSSWLRCSWMLAHWFRLTARNRYTAGQPSQSTGVTESSTFTPTSSIAGLLNRVAQARYANRDTERIAIRDEDDRDEEQSGEGAGDRSVDGDERADERRSLRRR